MTLREALVFAVEALRTNAGDDPTSRAAAKVLERKAERMRARTEKSWLNVRYCFCGEHRGEKSLICPSCEAAVPARVMIRFHLGRGEESSRALRTIKEICNRRANKFEEAA